MRSALYIGIYECVYIFCGWLIMKLSIIQIIQYKIPYSFILEKLNVFMVKQDHHFASQYKWVYAIINVNSFQLWDIKQKDTIYCHGNEKNGEMINEIIDTRDES